jgi:hypothetical protein
MDRNFFELTCRLSWITPNHFDINKKFINEQFWKRAIDNLNKIDEEKSPYDKLRCVLDAYNNISNCIKFSSGKVDVGVEDVTPILHYIIIRSKPRRMFSNIK